MLQGKKIRILFVVTGLAVIWLLWFLFYVEHSNPSSYLPFKLQVASNQMPLDVSDAFDRDMNSDLFMRPKIVFHGERIVHIDLKGAPPRVSYYKEFFRLLVKLGATGVIIEYEDMFPYHGPLLANISAHNAYTLNDIKTINDLANKMHLKVIPLVQTFGHMEFLLKLRPWKHLREVPKYPQVLCPSHNQTLPLLLQLVEQVLEAHPNSNMLHIGADEVYLLGECDRCFIKMNMNGWTKQKLFLQHVSTVANAIKERHPNVRLLMWDDEFRKVRQEDLEKWRIASLVEPVVWKYTRDVYAQLGSSLWDMYASVFPRLWIASAFKGATGSDKYTTDISHHLENHRSWMQVVAEYSGRIKFEGIILTGWQRYDHFAVLCELLPVGIPSLAMNLHLIQGYIDSTLVPPQAVAALLQCENPYALLGPALGTPKCNFAGGNVLEAALKLSQLNQELASVLDDSKVRGWMTEYNVNHVYSNLLFVESAMENLNMFKMQLSQIEADMVQSMQQMYDNYTVAEWCELNIRPLYMKIETLWEAKEKLLNTDNWPRRPFRTDDDRKDL